MLVSQPFIIVNYGTHQTAVRRGVTRIRGPLPKLPAHISDDITATSPRAPEQRADGHQNRWNSDAPAICRHRGGSNHPWPPWAGGHWALWPVCTWTIPAEVFAAPRKRTVAPAPDSRRGSYQRHSEWDIIKAKTFRESGGPMSEVFERFGIPERSLRRMIKEDRGRVQMGKEGCLCEVIHQLREEVKVAT